MQLDDAIARRDFRFQLELARLRARALRDDAH
jgi:hypothetical protein